MDRIRPHKPGATEPSLADAQLGLAREYGFESWPRLVHHVEALNDFELDHFDRIARDFVAAYAAWVMWRREVRWPVAAALLLIVPVLWLGGDWWGSGDPFHGSNLAKGFRSRVIQHREAAVKRDEHKHVKLDRSTSISLDHTYRGARVLLRLLTILLPP